MTPHLGQGVNQTFEDAVALGHAVAKWGAIPQALRAYEAERVPQATPVQEVPPPGTQAVSQLSLRVVLYNPPASVPHSAHRYSRTRPMCS